MRALGSINLSQIPVRVLVLFFIPVAIVAYFYSDGLSWVVNSWKREEYSHAYLIPLISIYLLWQKREIFEVLRITGSWVGAGVAALGVGIMLLGELATLYAIIGYGFVTFLIGVFWAISGWRVFKESAPALFLFYFMIPLPTFIFNNISQDLQLISSEIGVMVIRLFGISVFLEGNVIDLGEMKLQVVEACNGLRYLFPLMTLAFMMSLFFRVSMWKRVVLFLSSIPITILMNSFRIGVIGVLVEHWGVSMAEGFLHDFEGWVVFMAAFGVLILEMWVLAKIGSQGKSLAQVFSEEPINKADIVPMDAPANASFIPRPYLGALLLLIPLVGLAIALPSREEVLQPRTIFADFPMEIGEWEGKRDSLDELFLDALDLDDYLLANYSHQGGPAINLYIAWYDSQRKGESAHSPRSCLPGGGWVMTEFDQVTILGAQFSDRPVRVNRTVIELHDTKQVVYYWFQQRGRSVTNEYLVKWYLFWDSLTRNRSDGALVRLTTAIAPGDTVAAGDKRLGEFLQEAAPRLPAYIPD